MWFPLLLSLIDFIVLLILHSIMIVYDPTLVLFPSIFGLSY